MPRGLVSLLCILPAVLAATGPASSARPLPFFYDLYTFRGDTGSTTVVATFAVPAGRLEKETGDGEVRYRFDVTLVLADTALRSVSRTDDSVFVGFPLPPADEHLLYTHIEVQAPPSVNTLQRVIMSDATTPGIGQLYRSAFPIPDYSGTELMLSDIALAEPDVVAGWERGDITLALLPTDLLPGGLFDLYYEIYNLPYGHRYSTEIAIEPVADSGGVAVAGESAASIRFSGESMARWDASVQELRRVQAALDRGRYRLTVTITDEDTGRAATRSRLFQVTGWERGGTLVPALPWRGRS